MSARIVGLCGYKRSGKSRSADRLVDDGYQRLSFAEPIKQMLYALGLTEEHLYGDLKDVPCDLLHGQTPRWAMQSLGTQWGRMLIHEDIWVRAAGIKAKRHLLVGTSVVCDDVRFHNEVKEIHDQGGLLIRVVRAGCETSDHESERDIASLDADFVVINDGSIADLQDKVVRLIQIHGDK
jgi:hypothetical protein